LTVETDKEDASLDWTFGGSWSYAPRFFEHENGRLHYVDEGTGEPVVMLHGNPTWGYVYRNFIAPLSANRRSVVPDHMGFGRSDKPLDEGRYRLTRHVENLTTLLLALDLRDTTLVMQDWGGPIGFGFATEHPERIKRLVILNIWVFLYPEDTKLHGLLELFRQHHVGEAMVQSLNLFVEGGVPAGRHLSQGKAPGGNVRLPRTLPGLQFAHRTPRLPARHPGRRRVSFGAGHKAHRGESRKARGADGHDLGYAGPGLRAFRHKPVDRRLSARRGPPARDRGALFARGRAR
jgi:pimeloyl-ACP methyl ester carboxylesterase